MGISNPKSPVPDDSLTKNEVIMGFDLPMAVKIISEHQVVDSLDLFRSLKVIYKDVNN